MAIKHFFSFSLRCCVTTHFTHFDDDAPVCMLHLWNYLLNFVFRFLSLLLFPIFFIATPITLQILQPTNVWTLNEPALWIVIITEAQIHTLVCRYVNIHRNFHRFLGIGELNWTYSVRKAICDEVISQNECVIQSDWFNGKRKMTNWVNFANKITKRIMPIECSSNNTHTHTLNKDKYLTLSLWSFLFASIINNEFIKQPERFTFAQSARSWDFWPHCLHYYNCIYAVERQSNRTYCLLIFVSLAIHESYSSCNVLIWIICRIKGLKLILVLNGKCMRKNIIQLN